MIIWPPSPVLRQDTIPTSHRTRFPVNARGDMALALSCESVPPLPSVPLTEARRKRRMHGPGSVAEYGIPARTMPAPPRHRSGPRSRTPRTVTASPSSTAVSAAPQWAAGKDVLVRCDRRIF
jgi:hypothetical protein